jgi:site-specific DNA-methyltransferase (adenine-specific)
MGSGSTVAAAEAQGLACIGIERFQDYFELSQQAIPRLADLRLEAEMVASRLNKIASCVIIRANLQ